MSDITTEIETIYIYIYNISLAKIAEQLNKQFLSRALVLYFHFNLKSNIEMMLMLRISTNRTFYSSYYLS